MIEIKEVTKSFGTRRVLDRLSFSVEPGKIVYLLGRSGAGKSVLLKSIVGLTKLDSGKIRVDESEVTTLSENALLEMRRHCAMVFQQPALLDSLTVYENVGFGLLAEGISQEEENSRIRAAMKSVGMSDEVLTEYPLRLSFGAQKRISIARALALSPNYFLFDEPTTGLDPILTHSLNDLILRLVRGTKRSALVVSHDVESAIDIADQIILLHEGRPVFFGTPGEFVDSSQEQVSLFRRYGRW